MDQWIRVTESEVDYVRQLRKMLLPNDVPIEDIAIAVKKYTEAMIKELKEKEERSHDD